MRVVGVFCVPENFFADGVDIPPEPVFTRHMTNTQKQISQRPEAPRETLRKWFR